jgi:hypothetical protein
MSIVSLVYAPPIRMQPFPIPFEPTNLTPCFTLRSRREVNSIDTVNSRLVEHWQTDDPAVQFSRRDVSGVAWWMDMNPTASRLYREDIKQNQSFVIPAGDSPAVRKTLEINEKLNQTRLAIESLQKKPMTPTIQTQLNQLQEIYNVYLQEQKEIQRNTLAEYPAFDKFIELKTKINETLSIIQTLQKKSPSPQVQAQLAHYQNLYSLYVQEQKLIETDSIAQNPYFDKYDIASDSRNVIRELRGAVSEDIVDRGLRENQRLMSRGFDSQRWVPQGLSEMKGIDQLTAFELIRPKVDDFNKIYKK